MQIHKLHLCIGLYALITTIAFAPIASAIEMDGSLPMYPRGTNMNAGMPANAIHMGVPLVLETTDAVHLVDLWYKSNAPQCARTEASGGVKYQCAGGSIMIYPHGGKTQVAFVPAMPHF